MKIELIKIDGKKIITEIMDYLNVSKQTATLEEDTLEIKFLKYKIPFLFSISNEFIKI